jgi:hypothetical protein
MYLNGTSVLQYYIPALKWHYNQGQLYTSTVEVKLNKSSDWIHFTYSSNLSLLSGWKT